MPTVRRQGFRRIGRADDGERIRRSHEQQDDAKKFCISTVFFALHNYLQNPRCSKHAIDFNDARFRLFAQKLIPASGPGAGEPVQNGMRAAQNVFMIAT
jgi:hypothetical protein